MSRFVANLQEISILPQLKPQVSVNLSTDFADSAKLTECLYSDGDEFQLTQQEIVRLSAVLRPQRENYRKTVLQRTATETTCQRNNVG